MNLFLYWMNNHDVKCCVITYRENSDLLTFFTQPMYSSLPSAQSGTASQNFPFGMQSEFSHLNSSLAHWMEAGNTNWKHEQIISCCVYMNMSDSGIRNSKYQCSIENIDKLTSSSKGSPLSSKEYFELKIQTRIENCLAINFPYVNCTYNTHFKVLTNFFIRIIATIIISITLWHEQYAPAVIALKPVGFFTIKYGAIWQNIFLLHINNLHIPT